MQSKTEGKGLTYSQILFFYLFAGLAGTIWETSVVLIFQGRFEFRNASFISPFNFVYGSGFLLMVLFLRKVKSPLPLFLYGSILGGVAEYLLSLGEEITFHSRSWDYSDMFLNINGRTSIPYMLVWGALCLLTMRYVYPQLIRLYYRIPPKALKALTVILTVYVVADLSLSGAVLFRFAARRGKKAAVGFIGKKIDAVFTEEVIHRFFPNMVFFT